MRQTIIEQLEKKNITLPTPAAPAANYIPYHCHGGLLYISGQLPMKDGKLALTGIVGQDVSKEDAIKAAELCAINILAQAEAAVGLENLTKCVKLGGFVASTANFTDQPMVINGASNLMVDILGKDIGSHTRFAVGAPALPLNASVEIDAIFACKE